MFSRKKFIQNSLIIGAGAGLVSFDIRKFQQQSAALPEPPDKNPEADEDYWSQISAEFIQSGDYIRLENGYFSPMPVITLNQLNLATSHINATTSWFMRNEQSAAWEKERKALAEFLGVPQTELAFTRNTTESMNILISGYPWQNEDEVIVGDQDYGSMIAAFRQAEKRHGIRIKTAVVPLNPANDEEIVSAYMSLATPKTKVIHLTHLINITGQVIPVREICREAHEKGIEVMVDSAHSNAQLNFVIPDLEADYVGASLHKWLCCPLGTGYLWMRSDKIKQIWPLMGDSDYPDTDIRKFEHQGTRPVQNWQGISTAIAFHNKIGSELIEKRLKYLMKTWCRAVDGKSGIKILTPWSQDSRNSAIACVSVTGFTPEELQKTLLEKYRIFTVAINHPVVKGVRVTPHIFTPLKDVMALSEALTAIAATKN